MKKGFTLAELLGVIVIIGLLLLLLIPLIINGIKSRQDDVKYIQDDIMEEIAGQYMDLDKEKYPGFAGDIYCISFKELSDAGLLDKVLGSLGDDDSYDINKTAIQVNVLDGGKKTYEVTNTNECSNKQSQNIIITVTPPNNKWALSKTVTIKYPDLGSGKTNQYRIDKGQWKTVSGNTVSFDTTKNIKVETRVINKNGETAVSKKGNVEKVDSIKPVIKQIERTTWDEQQNQLVNITVTDADSGVAAYCIVNNLTVKDSHAVPGDDDQCWTSYKLPAYGGTGTIKKNLPQGEYAVFVKDQLGNKSDYNDKFVFEVKDDVAPECEINLKGNNLVNEFYQGNVEVSLEYSDDASGVKQYGLSTEKEPTYNSETKITHTEDTSGTVYYGHVEDKAGNKGICQKIVKKETENPTVDFNSSSTTKSINVVADGYAPSGIVKYEFSINNGAFIDNGDNPMYPFDNLKHNTCYTIKVRVTSGIGKTAVISKQVCTKNLQIPTFTEVDRPGNVIITFPDECGKTLTCSYIKDGGTEVPVTTPTVNLPFTENGTIVGKVSDGNNTVSSSYTVELTRSAYANAIYVCPSGYTATGTITASTSCRSETSTAASQSSGSYYCTASTAEWKTVQLKYFSNFQSSFGSISNGYHCIISSVITGNVTCKDGIVVSHTLVQDTAASLGWISDINTYNDGGTCPATGEATLHPSITGYKLYDQYLAYRSGSYYCSNGTTPVGSRCHTYKSSQFSYYYYYCPNSKWQLDGTTCTKIAV